MKTNYFFERYVTDKDKEAYLFFRLRKRNPVIDIRISTQVKVNVTKWEEARKDLRALAIFEKSKYGSRIISKADKAYSTAVELYNNGVTDKDTIKKAIFNAINSDEIQEATEVVKAMEEAEERKAQEVEEQRKRAEQNPVKMCKEFINGISSGDIRQKKNKLYTKNTIKSWNSFYLVLEKFYKTKRFTWDDINVNLSNRFVSFLENEKYMETTRNKYMISFKRLVGYYYGKAHTNVNATKVIEKNSAIDSDAKAMEIYLKADEVEALYNMKLTGLKEQVRDLFMVGVYTAQRYSDFSTIKEEDFGTTAKGVKVVRFKQQKTGNKVTIPLLNGNLAKIVSKYNYNLPSVSDVIMNRYIKEICKELSDEVPTLSKMVKTNLTMKEKSLEAQGKATFEHDANGNTLRPRYECVTTHTARRTGITLMYLTQKYNILQMMSVSGHKTEKTFKEYIKLNEDEKADEIAEIADSDGLF